MTPATFCYRTALSTLLLLALAGCAAPGAADLQSPGTTRRAVMQLPPADVLLLGERHDAAAHQQVQAEAVAALADAGRLAAVAMEMAEAGRSTADLPAGADDAAIRRALAWDDRAWPWRAYGPVVVAAVRAGVPVLGANLPRANQRNAMADVSLDVQLAPEAWAAQQRAIREGHCRALPEAQIQPMTRVQVARDRAMAHTVAQAVRPGRTVLLVTGSAHADKLLGVPQHLPATLRVQSVLLLAAAAAPASESPHDAVWLTGAIPPGPGCG